MSTPNHPPDPGEHCFYCGAEFDEQPTPDAQPLAEYVPLRAERDNLRTALHAARAELMLAEVGEKNPRDAVHWALIFLERGIK